MLRWTPIIAAFSLASCASSPAPQMRANLPVQAVEAQPAAGAYQPNAYLKICPQIRVSNAPGSDGQGWVQDYNPIIEVNTIVLASVPSNDVCLSSGFGPRYGRMHEGIDLQSRPAGPVYATAPGRVIEARHANGYGLQVLIDHGRGVYTRYGHLAHIDGAIRPGAKVGFGQSLGMMGDTGNATAIHVHYEILLGNYNNPQGSKGLMPRDPFSFPAYGYRSG